MDSLIGKRIEGRYLLAELVGVGGMANVYRAEDAADGKTVAVKVLREEFSSSEEFLRRFKNESKAIALLSHPNIIQVYDVCFSPKLPSIVMEFIDGVTLKEYMESRGALPYKEALHFITQVLAALEHAHEHGIVHRDVKPQNVMLLSDGTVKITDFGIARFARSEAQTVTDRAIGSVHYISPEQARGASADNRADLYSAGAMLYEMLTGKLPFDGDTPVSVALKHIELDPPGIRELKSDLPEGLEQIVARAMAKNPDDRYRSAADMSEDIAAFKRNPSISFDYKYLGDADQNELKRTLMKAQSKKKPADPRAPRPERAGSYLHDTEGEALPPRGEKRPLSLIAVLGGIAAAFVLGAGVFIALMVLLNNPFRTVADVEMPNLIGSDYEAVRNSPDYTFVFEIEEREHSYNYANGQIYDQSPRAGRTVKEGARVRVKVSLGPLELSMPSLVGKTAEEALAELGGLNLSYRTVEVFSPIYEVGVVVATAPGWGEPVQGDTEVELQVSKGPDAKPVPVPELVGLSLDDARKLAGEMGFSVGGVSYVYSDRPFNTVVAQDPLSDATLVEGGLINLNISYGNNEVAILTLDVPLPQTVTELVELSCMVDGEIVKAENLYPNEVEGGLWRPSFEGQTAANVIVLFNKEVYQRYSLDFTTGEIRLTEDNSGSFA